MGIIKDLKRQGLNLKTSKRFSLNDFFVTGVYKLYKNKKIVYIGQSVNVGRRINDHLIENVKDFDSFAFINCSGLDSLTINEIEKELIQYYWPKYNINHNK